MILYTFSEFMSNNIHTFRKLLPNNGVHIFRVHIKHYWHFQGVTPKQHYTLFQTSNNTDISRKLLANNYTLFQNLHQTIRAFSELLANNTAHTSRVYIKQYWYFQRVTGKQYYKLFSISHHYQTILTLSESYYQTILTYSELILDSIDFPSP